MEKDEKILQIMELMQTKKRAAHINRKNEESSAAFVRRYLSRRDGQEVNPSDICKAMDVSTPRITKILNEMEEQGLIVREISADDRRKISVKLTDKGRVEAEEGKKKHRSGIESLLNKLGPDDTEALIRILEAEIECLSEGNYL